MGINPYQGQTPDQPNQQGGYGGYQPQRNEPGSPQQYGGYQQPNTGSQDYQYGQYTYGQQQQQQQQYGAYQPPSSTMRGAGGSAGANEPTTTGMNARTEGALSYLLFFFSGIVFFLIERRNRFVRFCAAQSTLLFGGLFILYLVLRLIIALPIIGFLLSPVVGCVTGVVLIAGALLWIFLAVQAYRGVKVKLPFIGDYAERMIGRTGSH